MSKRPFVLPLEHIGELVLLSFCLKAYALTLLTSVTRYESLTVRECSDSKTAVVTTVRTLCVLALHLELIKIALGKYRGIFFSICELGLGDQCRTESTHKACNIRSYDISSGYDLKASQDGIVKECTTLNDDILTELLGISDLDDLIERITYYGVRKTRGDVTYRCALLLSLLYLGVHEYRTSRTEVNGVSSLQCLDREVMGIHAECLCECLDKGSASRGTCFVQHDRIDYAVSYPHALHVLTADIDDEINIGTEELG